MRGGTGRKKIEIKKRETASERMVTFSKRRKGLFKKVDELHSKTGAVAAVAVFSPAGNPYVHGAPSFDSVLSQYFKLKMGHENHHEYNAHNASTRSDLEEEGSNRPAAEPPAKEWLESLKVDECESLEELMVLLNKLEEIERKAEDLVFVESLFV